MKFLSRGTVTVRLRCHVTLDINAFLRILWKGNLELLLDAVQHFLILICADEADGNALGAETSGTTDTVKIAVCICWQVVVDSEVDSLNVNATTEDVGGDTDALLELLELLVTLDAAKCQLQK